ncbi:hypothetical protein CLOM_g23966 [Closterium sp. NIES-68]|nr:hypothetical protein CLOM_g23966 [Closterium sp. NIES-68]
MADRADRARRERSVDRETACAKRPLGAWWHAPGAEGERTGETAGADCRNVGGDTRAGWRWAAPIAPAAGAAPTAPPSNPASISAASPSTDPPRPACT